MKILLVDDEREGISFLIRKFRYPLEVVQACNGKEALYILEHQEIDILFTDVRMPVMSGLELVRAVREKQKKIKIVIFSAYAEFEYAKQAVEMNALRYLLKPIEINEFRTLMDDILLSLKQEQKKNKKDRRDWLFKLFTSAKLDEEAEVQIRNAFFPSCESSCRFLNMEFVNNYFEENEEQFLRIVQKYFGEKTEYVTVYPNEA